MEVEDRPTDGEDFAVGKKHRCIKPMLVDGGDIDAVERMLASHNWKLRTSRRQRTGIYIAYICRDCGAERIGMIHQIHRPGENSLSAHVFVGKA